MSPRTLLPYLSFAGLAALAACTSEAVPGCPLGSVLAGDGQCRSGCTDDSQCLAEEHCDSTVHACVRKTPTNPTPPIIDHFTVTPEMIATPGAQVTFEYSVMNAKQVEITPGVLDKTSVLSGVVTAPVQATTTFTLTAYGDGGMNATELRMVTLQGQPPPGPVAILSFDATPHAVRNGDQITLTWNVVNAAAGSIRISAPPERNYLLEGAPDMGSMTDQASRNLPITYWIDATGENGLVVRQSASVLRAGEGAAKIESFAANPPMISPLDTALIAWETTGADAVTLNDGSGVLYTTHDALEAQHGFRLVSPPITTGYTLQADAQGGGAVQMTQLMVKSPTQPEVQPPEPGAEPVVRGMFNSTNAVNVHWDIANADQVTLSVNNGAPMMVPAMDRQSLMPLSTNMKFHLVADKGGSVVESRFYSFVLGGESSFNDSADYADPLDDVGLAATLHHLDEVDWFKIDLAEDKGVVVASVFGLDAAGCGDAFAAISFDLIGPDQTTVVASRMLNGNGCPAIAAEHLDAGTYYFRVTLGQAMVDFLQYNIVADSFGPICGDQISEGTETCDDGNRLAGDGCDGYCHAEPRVEYDPPSINAVQSFPSPMAPPNPVVFKPGAPAVIPLPFIFDLYGRKYAGAVVHTSGYLSFRPAPEDSGPPAAIPNAAAPNAVIAPFWADLRLADFSDARGEVLYWMRGGGAMGANRRLDIYFHNLTGAMHTESDHVLLDAVVSLEEMSNVVRIYYGKLSAVGNVRATMAFAGIEDETGTRGVRVPGCEPACGPGSDLENKVVTFTPHVQ